MKRKAWYLILFFLLVLTACAKEQPEENPDQEHVQSLPLGGQTEQPEENPDQEHAQSLPLSGQTEQPEENPDQENVLSLPLGGQTVEVTVDSRLSLHECPGLFLDQAGRAVQLEGVRWFHVMANEKDKDYYFTFSEQNAVEQLQNSVFEWMAIPKEMLPVACLYGPLTWLTYIGDDEDYYYLAETHTNGYLSVASIIADGEVNEFGNWGKGYARVDLSERYNELSKDCSLLENAVKDRITPFQQSPLTTVNSPLLLFEADYYSELPYRGTILDEDWVADVSWAKSQLLEHAQDYAYPEELVKKVRDESEAGVSQNDWSMTILETDPGAVIDARAQIYARIKAFGRDVSLDQVVVLLGKSWPTGEAPLCSVWLEEDGKLVWWDGYYEYFFQDIQPAVSIVKKMFGRNDDFVKDDLNEPSTSPEVIENIPTAAGNQVPYWAQGTQTKGNLYQGLNLDGIGEADDEVYVGMYEYGDEYKEVIVLRAHLGTGETLVEIYPLFDYQDYSFMTGRLFSEDRDAVILGVQSGNSNYNATNIWVLKVSPADPAKHIFAEMWVALDTAARPNGMSLDILSGNGSSWGLDSSDGSTLMTRDPEVVDIEGSPLQGLKVTIFDSHEGADKELENVIYWKDGLWEDGNRTYIGKWEFLGEWTPKAE